MCRVVFEHTWATNPKVMLKLLNWYKCKPELPLKFRKNFCKMLFCDVFRLAFQTPKKNEGRVVGFPCTIQLLSPRIPRPFLRSSRMSTFLILSFSPSLPLPPLFWQKDTSYGPHSECQWDGRKETRTYFVQRPAEYGRQHKQRREEDLTPK